MSTKRKQFELFMGCLGNGITVCNKAKLIYGDYEYVAHISPQGRIAWHVPQDQIPKKEKQRILKAAEDQKEEFKSWWNVLDVWKKYEFFERNLPWKDFREVLTSNMSVEEKVKVLEQKYMKL